MDWADVLKVSLPLLLGVFCTWLAGVLRSKPAKQQEQSAAEKERVAAQAAAWELWASQFGWAKQELVELRKLCEDQEKRLAQQSKDISTGERRYAELLIKQAELEQRQDDMQTHIDDLWQAIEDEPDGGKAIKDRLKTKRPAARTKAPANKTG